MACFSRCKKAYEIGQLTLQDVLGSLTGLYLLNYAFKRKQYDRPPNQFFAIRVGPRLIATPPPTL